MRATNRRYVTESEIRAAKQIDLLTYLQTYEPNELVKDGSGYHTRTHDSLKISNGMWHWFSRGIGGRTALDYLMHVRNMDFVPAVQLLCGLGSILPPSSDKEGNCEHRDILPPSPGKERKEPKAFELPPTYPDCSRVTRYLRRRGISSEVLRRFIDEGALYEANRYHNAVFVGRELQLMALGDNVAHSLGLRVERFWALFLVAAAMLAGAAVSFAGLLSFVGLVAPHMTRILLKNDAQLQLPIAATFGAALCLICDLIARVAFAPFELPVGIVLSIVGAPFFLYLLLIRKKRSRHDAT